MCTLILNAGQGIHEKLIEGEPDGKQVRDILFVEDLVEAFIRAQKNMGSLAGKAFNMGGGTENTVSLLEILHIIKEKTGREMNISYDKWRTGDQFYYVSDTSKFKEATGWSPKYSVDKGIEALVGWLCTTRGIKPEINNHSNKAIAI